MERKLNARFSLLLLSAMLVLGLWGCVRESIQHTTSDTVNITQYLGKYPDKFSLMSKILNISGTASFLKAYGSYTMFAPTDDAIRAYLKTINKSAVEDVSAGAWKDFVRFHVLVDSLPTSRFTDGKLPTLTMYGQYLITQAVNTAGITQIVVNRQANITQANVSTGNGIIHVVDHVLIPATLTVAQTIEANPKYTIFTQALKETTLYDSLNYAPANNPDTTRRFLTMLAESDDVLKAAGINSYADLKAKYSKGNPKNPTDSLHLFMDYHVLYEAKYLADIITASAHNTLAPSQVITSKLLGTTVLINDDDFNGVHEPGQVLNRDLSDVTATNGVIHDAAAHFGIKVRSPYPVYFDICAIPDVMKNTAVYRKATTYTYTAAEATSMADLKLASNTSGMIYTGNTGNGKTSYLTDYMVIPFGVTSRPLWVEFRTPLVIRGTYKIWICYYAQPQTTGVYTEAAVTIGLDGTTDRAPLSNARTINFATKRPGITKKDALGNSVTDIVAEEAVGIKSYMANTAGSQVGRLVGVANITKTGRYWIRLTAVNGTQNTNNLDMIQLIPASSDQQYPKFNPDGSQIPHP